MEYEIERFLHAPLAQLDRVAHYECEGWGFESLMAHQQSLEISMISRLFFCFFSAWNLWFPSFFPLFSAVQLMIHILSCAGLDDLQADSSIFCWRSFMHTMYYTSETYILLDKIKNALKNVLLEHFIFTGTELYDGAVFSLFSLIFSMVFHLKRVWQIWCHHAIISIGG